MLRQKRGATRHKKYSLCMSLWQVDSRGVGHILTLPAKGPRLLRIDNYSKMYRNVKNLPRSLHSTPNAGAPTGVETDRSMQWCRPTTTGLQGKYEMTFLQH